MKIIVENLPIGDSTSYSGDVENNMLHGDGVMTFRSGAVYTGGFNNSQFDGLGKMALPDGTTMGGTFFSG